MSPRPRLPSFSLSLRPALSLSDEGRQPRPPFAPRLDVRPRTDYPPDWVAFLAPPRAVRRARVLRSARNADPRNPREKRLPIRGEWGVPRRGRGSGRASPFREPAGGPGGHRSERLGPGAAERLPRGALGGRRVTRVVAPRFASIGRARATSRAVLWICAQRKRLPFRLQAVAGGPARVLGTIMQASAPNARAPCRLPGRHVGGVALRKVVLPVAAPARRDNAQVRLALARRRLAGRGGSGARRRNAGRPSRRRMDVFLAVTSRCAPGRARAGRRAGPAGSSHPPPAHSPRPVARDGAR